MDVIFNPPEVLSMASLILLMLLDAHRSLQLFDGDGNIDDVQCNYDVDMDDAMEVTSAAHMQGVTHAALQQLALWSTLSFVDDDLGYWVKPRSTTWFSRFVLEEFDDDRWVQMFRMTKRSMFSLATILQPTIRRRDTKYRVAIPVIVRLACTLFKLSHGASLLVCSEFFAVGRSTVSVMLREVVQAINVLLRSEISWPSGENLLRTAADFQQLCGLPGVVGAIDGTQIPISKPKFSSADYFYFKSGGYSMNCQAVVDSSKRFLDLNVGMPGSTNDARMLRRSALYEKAQRNVLWDAGMTFSGFSPHLLGDAGYPLLPWLMVPHRQQQQLVLADALFNKRMCKGRVVVENAFALLKQSFKELHVKSDLHVTFLPDVVMCCGLLHNMLLKQSHEDVERLLDILRGESVETEAENNNAAVYDHRDALNQAASAALATQKRRDLGVYLAVQRVVPL